VILDEIINFKKIEVKEKKRQAPVAGLEKKLKNVPAPRGFLNKSNKIQLIAELKKASPSRGILRADFEPAKLALACADAGAGALSVLTDQKFFQGSNEYMKSVVEAVSIPVLKKDFVIDEYQIVEGRAYGASAVLLLVSVLSTEMLERFIGLCRDLGMGALVEAYNEEEIKRALDAGAKTIGINNRDLKTFKVDIENTACLAEKIPEDKIIVGESGIKTRDDMLYLQKAGVDAALVGESIMTAEQPENVVKELLGYGKS